MKNLIAFISVTLLGGLFIYSFTATPSADVRQDVVGSIFTESNEIAPFAEITLLSESGDQVIQSDLADVNGNFDLKAVQTGKYKLVVSYIGSSSKVQDIEVGPEGPTDLDFIKLNNQFDEYMMSARPVNTSVSRS